MPVLDRGKVVKHPTPRSPQSCLDVVLRSFADYDAGLIMHMASDESFPCVHTVETCVNGKEALKLLRDKDKSFDLVLSDVYMPGAMQTPAPSDPCLGSWPACSRAGC